MPTVPSRSVHEWHKSWRILSQTLNFFLPTSKTVEKIEMTAGEKGERVIDESTVTSVRLQGKNHFPTVSGSTAKTTHEIRLHTQ